MIFLRVLTLFPLGVLTWIVSLINIIFAPVLALFINSEGYLPFFLNWFQPSDNPAIGDQPWKEEHPTYGNYRLAVTYMIRNPGQGFDQFISADIDEKTDVKVYGDINTKDGENGVQGWYFITGDGYFHFSYIWHIPFTEKCLTGGLGWRLHPLALGYKHKTLGQFVFTPFRFYRFT